MEQVKVVTHVMLSNCPKCGETLVGYGTDWGDTYAVRNLECDNLECEFKCDEVFMFDRTEDREGFTLGANGERVNHYTGKPIQY